MNLNEFIYFRVELVLLIDAKWRRYILNKHLLSWSDVERMVSKLLHELPSDYDNIMVITRGGMVPACLISEKTNLRNILCAAVMFYDEYERKIDEPIFLQFPQDGQIFGMRILVVDDVWDTGKTIMAVRERIKRSGGKADVCVLNYKPSKSKFPNERPDYFAQETDEWIVYPWDPERELEE